MEPSGHHYVAIFGGSVAGSEAAFQLAERGIRVVVFDQNTLPYGKIEDGLPLWHIKLRNKEEQNIDEKLSHPNIRFVPDIRLGRDIDFNDVVRNWGFSAVIIAVGAWKDRPLPVEGIDAYVGKGLIYQNPLIYWFNHKHEPDYSGPEIEIDDNALIIGGGLASLDVVKVVMIETVQKALQQKGINEDIFTLARSIKKVLEKHNLTISDLGLNGCTLFYRRRGKDMPLTSSPKETPDQIVKIESISQKVIDNSREKYLFHFEECYTPIDKIVQDGKLKGLIFQKTEVVNGNLRVVEGETKKAEGSVVISSIGSIPEKIPGIPSEKEIFKITDPVSCRIEGYDNVFAIGNAVTGRGNIKESLHHGRETTLKIMDQYLDMQETDFHNYLRNTEDRIALQATSIAEQISQKSIINDEAIRSILAKTRKFQDKVGFNGSYLDWIDRKKPVRLEKFISSNNV
ncbi:MAG: FAD-dependent oxidoreductase [Bacteroidetes bacterium]|nr:FAD-dependent oxidoreductase [Bacteroidota bacterium]